jgi:phosphoglycerol transferase MdoB-like AlkP superfamily enzyme
MKESGDSGTAPWRTSRYGFATLHFATLVTLWVALRLCLLAAFRPPALSASQMFFCLGNGLQRDVFVALVFTLPVLFWFWVVPESWAPRRWHRSILLGASFLFWFMQFFWVCVEFFFFEEFRSRFNTVAVDYLYYPHEVFVNIWESYHVGYIFLACSLLALGWVWMAGALLPRMWERSFELKSRFLHFVTPVMLALALSSTFHLRSARSGGNRTLNEIANNGVLSFAAAARTRDLDYAAFYKTLPLDEAYARARKVLSEPGATFTESGRSIRRDIAGDTTRPRLNVVVFLEESLGSEFWGCLGRTNTLTPQMDKLALEQGLLFTDVFACGNRTVRGMEGVLSSFPPLPGDSIVKRHLSDNVETLGRVLKRDGYSTLFLYGGRGLFDGMRSYALRNGYDRFVEQKHFTSPTFTTIWGVSDEDLFERSRQEFRALAATGTPFFATILSVSNHKPYTYPKGRIPEDPEKRSRKNAVKYADYSLGKFFQEAKNEPFWTNTIFVVVADHGARVYGHQSIPIHSYEIPLVVLGPAVVKEPARISRLGNSLDVAPTILGLIGRPYESVFFGRDLLKGGPDAGRAFLNHNRDIGMLKQDRLVVLGLMQMSEFYEGNPKLVEMTSLANTGDSERELEQDAIAIYQVADDLYRQRRYRIDEDPPGKLSARH